MYFLNKILAYWCQRKRILRWGHTVIDSDTSNYFNTVKENMGITDVITLIISEEANGPLMLGFFKPYLILPREYSRNELEYIFRHELTHYKRHDLWYKLILLLANSIHWFNPIVYIMICAAENDIELSCDECIIKGMDNDERKVYSTIIFNEIQISMTRNTVLTTCFSGTRSIMMKRFENILSKNKKSLASLLYYLLQLSLSL